MRLQRRIGEHAASHRCSFTQYLLFRLGRKTLVFTTDRQTFSCELGATPLPGSDQAGVGLEQVVGDVPVCQVQKGVSCGLQSLAGWGPPSTSRTDGHHGQLLAGAALAGG